MKISYNWLLDYIETNASPTEISNKLNSIGIEVEDVVSFNDKYKNIVIGQIKEVKKHSNADKLNVCMVDIGGEDLSQIVCGANNVRAGLKVAVSVPGAIIKNIKIKKSKIRNVESNGMICSSYELDLGSDHDGILELPDNLNIGEDFSKAYLDEDVVFDVSITPNRGDCASHYGLARDLSATNIGNLKDKPNANISLKGKEGIEVRSDFDMKFNIIKINNVKIEPSSLKIQKRLSSIGMKPKNNIVDLSNYLLMSYGLPIHIYDADKIEGGFHVRYAKDGEEFQTLKEEDLILNNKSIVVSDEKKAVCALCVMGGNNSAISEKTSNIIIECAYIEPKKIAISGRNLKIHSDSRFRAERGIDSDSVKDIAILTASEILNMSEGEIVSATFFSNFENKPKKLTYHISQFKKITGAEINIDEAINILQKLGFLCDNIDKKTGSFSITVPQHRHDTSIHQDISEELLRIKGLDIIPETKGEKDNALRINHSDPLFEKLKRIRRILSHRKNKEVINYSFVNDKIAEIFTDKINDKLYILNPLNEDESYITPSILCNLLQNIKQNINHYYSKSISLFEISNIFRSSIKYDTMVGGVKYGKNSIASINENKSIDSYSVKEDVYEVLTQLYGYKIIKLDKMLEKADDKYSHPYNSFVIKENDIIIAKFGQIHPKITSEVFKIEENVYFYEIYINKIEKNLSNNLPAEPIGMSKDLSFLMDKNQDIGNLINEIKTTSNEITDITINDLYYINNEEHKDKKSIMFSLYFVKDYPFNKKGLHSLFTKIKDSLEKKYNCMLRGNLDQ